MRKIDKIIIHCSATPPNMDIGGAEIDGWHRAQGWSEIGYHYVIRRNGTIENGRDISKVGAHARGYNRRSVGICLIGGVDENLKQQDNKTVEQEQALADLITKISIDLRKDLKIMGHNEVSVKACPSFDVQDWLKKNGYDEENNWWFV